MSGRSRNPTTFFSEFGPPIATIAKYPLGINMLSTISAYPYEPTTGSPPNSTGGSAPSICSCVKRAGALPEGMKSNLALVSSAEGLPTRHWETCYVSEGLTSKTSR